MTRRLLNLLTALSLLLCIAVLALWVRSYWARDQWSYRWREVQGDNDSFGAHGLTSLGGQVWIGYWWQDNRYLRRSHEGLSVEAWRIGSVQQQGSQFSPPAGVDSRAWRLGFGWSWYTHGTDAERAVIVPHWLLLAVSAAPAAAIVARRRRTQSLRRPAASCVHCGYDLRATPDKCPECGEEARAPW
jgi:hypothetical protein